MAVVTLKYIRDRPQLKKHLRYIAHRRGREGGSITRVLFNAAGLTDKQAVYELIDAAGRGTAFFKLMINPDPKREDTYKDLDLPHVTRQTILALEQQLGVRLAFAAVIHPADHSPLRHVHGIFLLPKRLSKAAFRKLRQIAWTTATAQARLQRRARDRILGNPRYRTLPIYRTLNRHQRYAQPPKSRPHRRQPLRLVQRASGYRPLRLQPGCRSCGYGLLTGISGFLALCPACGRGLQQKRMLRLTREVSG
jgi:hypothetical protein